MPRHAFNIIVPICLMFTAAGWTRVPAPGLAAGRASMHGGRTAPLATHVRRADSLTVSVINTMSHRMSLSYENGDKQVPLGNVEGSSTIQVVLRDLQRDSVTVSGSAPQHEDPFKKTFAVHSGAPAVWQF
jgi:hypothetical protein